jgi:nucleotide-binding universal stress UspA family protein
MAVALAAAAKGTIRLLAAIDPRWCRALAADPGARLGTVVEDVERLLHERAASELEHCRRVCERAGIACEVLVERRPPTEAILDAAAEFDLVVMGSRGRDALSSAGLGSHTQRVVTGTRTPVLVVH